MYAHHFLNYLSGGAMMVNLNGVETLYYGYTDNQGSLIALTDVSGNIAEKYAFDPWGARRNPNYWTQKDTRSSFMTNRGYTGHEHLDAFGIINMNGRVYDPFTAMFFSPDPFIQSAGDWKNYNRYSYCMNNPTKYTDPSGYRYADQVEQPLEQREYLPFTNHGGKGGGGNGSYLGSLSSAYWEATKNGYFYGFSSFRDEYDRQTESSSFNGTITIRYQTGYTVSGTTTGNNTGVYLPEFTTIWSKVTVKVGGGRSMGNGNSNGFINWGLAALTVEDMYNNFLHNHTTYKTTKGVVKDIFKANGVVRSERALQFARLSTAVKIAGDAGSLLTTLNAVNNINKGEGNTVLNWSDASVGSVGLINSSAGWIGSRLGLSSIPIVGEGVAVYSWARLWGDIGYNYGPSHWYGNDNTKWFK